MTLDGVDERIYSTTGQLQYLNRLELYRTEKPYEISVLPVNVQKPGARRTNLSFKSYPVELRDFSSQRQNHTTDTQGFELDSFPTSLSPENFKNLSDIESRYHAEACSFLKQKYGAIKVFVFDTTIREPKARMNDSTILLKNQHIMGPVRQCHIDLTPDSVHRRVKYNFPDKAEELLRHRVRVINIWRPLVWPCLTTPVACCDWRSTVPEDFTSSDLVTSVWEGESLQVYHNPAHEWWFAKEMREDDVLLIKMYDSEAERPGSGTAMGTPHCAFDWADAPEWAQPRQSVEIRAIIFS